MQNTKLFSSSFCVDMYVYCCLIISLCLRGIALTSLVPVSQTTAATRVHSAPWSCCRWSTGGDVCPAVGRLPSEGCITLMSGESHRCCSVISVLIAHTQDTACYGSTDTPHCRSVLFNDVFCDTEHTEDTACYTLPPPPPHPSPIHRTPHCCRDTSEVFSDVCSDRT